MASTRTFTTPRWLTIVAAILVTAISFLAFAISFAALSDLAARSGIPRQIAWAWPLIVDGSIVTAMLVIFAWRGQGRRQTTWPWITLCFFAVVSIVGNGVHTVAVLDVQQGVSVEFAIFVGALPPIGLLSSSEMLVRLLAGRTTAPTDAVTLAPEPEPEPRQPLSADDAAPAAVTRPISAMPNPVPVTQPVAPEGAPAVVVTAATTSVTRPEVTDNEHSDTSVTDLDVAATQFEDTSATTQESTGVTGPDMTPPAPASERHEVAAATEPPVLDDSADVTDGTADDTVTASGDTAASAAPRLRAVASVPDEPAAQVEWIVTRARNGRDTTKETLAALFAEAGYDMSLRTVQRRLADARKREPAAFNTAAAESSRTVATR